MTLHLGYPTVTKGHRLTGLTPAAEINQNPALDQTQANNTPLIVWKVHVANDREHDCHDSLHSVEVAQLYPHVGDFIAS
jgi:hypothetical protein